MTKMAIRGALIHQPVWRYPKPKPAKYTDRAKFRARMMDEIEKLYGGSRFELMRLAMLFGVVSNEEGKKQSSAYLLDRFLDTWSERFDIWYVGEPLTEEMYR